MNKEWPNNQYTVCLFPKRTKELVINLLDFQYMTFKKDLILISGRKLILNLFLLLNYLVKKNWQFLKLNFDSIE